jgi:hypothetical protein
LTAKNLNIVYQALTAQERAVLALRAWKEGTREDPEVRTTIPEEQVVEFNRLIDLMNGANGELATFIIIISEQVRKVDLRIGWLLAIELWEMEREDLWLKLCDFKHPVTESEHERRRKEEERKLLPADDLSGDTSQGSPAKNSNVPRIPSISASLL